jgi:hypothetical protein
MDTTDTMDTQLTELIGRNWLVNELLRAGLEVATPLRDRGIDLIAYFDLEGGHRRRECMAPLPASRLVPSR